MLKLTFLEYANKEKESLMTEIFDSAMITAASKLPDTYLNNLLSDCEEVQVTWNKKLKTTAGRATTNRNTRQGTIELNHALFTTTGTMEDFENTFKHELAHLLANFAFKKNCNHGRLWRSLFTWIGGNGERCHKIDVNHLRKRTRRHEYSCWCMTHEITTQKRNRILRGSVYRCRKCKQALKEVKNG